MGPFRVVVRRGDVVEAVHLVHVASTDGPLHGDDVVSFLRSAAKPVQAIPLAEAYDDLGDDELAIACSSHQAEPAQLDAVRKLLARAGATVDDLENGPQEGRPEGRLGHNCSGKHAGFLAACRANGWPFGGYRLPEHPLQQRIRALLGGGEMGIDGCGVPTYAHALSDAARLLLQASLLQQLSALGAASASIDVSRASVAAAEEDLRMQTERYRLGAVTIIEVLTSQANLEVAQVNLVTARYNYLVARAQIEALVGHGL